MSNTNVDLLARKIANVLINSGIRMMKSAFSLNPTITIYDDFVAFLKSKNPIIQTSILDAKYFLLPFYQWQQIIENDWVKLRKWYKDKFDCDDFARIFQAHCFELFEINSVGSVYGKVYVAADGTFIDYHYWNVIVSQEPEGKKMWFYEPQGDKWIEYNGGTVIIGSWKYEPIKFNF